MLIFILVLAFIKLNFYFETQTDTSICLCSVCRMFFIAQLVIEITDVQSFNLPKFKCLTKILRLLLSCSKTLLLFNQNIMLIIFKTQAPKIQLIIFSVMQA